MKINIPALVTLVIITLLMAACGTETESGPAVSEPADTDPAVVSTDAQDQLAETRDRIQSLLLTYYNDLAAEQLNAEDYFAPQLRRYYSQENISRDQVAQAIRNSFEQVEDRNIMLDRSSLEVRREGDEYVAVFEGDVSLTRSGDGSRVEERFRNRVVFNQDFRIVSYELLEAQQESSSRSLAPAARSAATGPQAVASVITALRTESSADIAGYIHPGFGYYYITRPGAMDAVYHFTQYQEIFDKANTPWMKEVFAGLTCNLQLEALPEFDCEEYSKEGCFMAETAGYDRVSRLMRTLTEMDYGEFSTAEIEAATRAEAAITHEMVITASNLSLCFGLIDGRWYLLVIDTARFDCSA